MATVKTVQVIDPRIEPQPEPLYTKVIGPRQNQYYQIPTSGLSDSYLTFNNITTLGTDRAYLDTFELEIHAELTFNLDNSTDPFTPLPFTWTFESFPFNKCCEEVRVNINGGAFFSSPLSYVRAKERYWSEQALSDCYENICPIHKPHLQSEVGDFLPETLANRLAKMTDTIPATFATVEDADEHDQTVITSLARGQAIPSRLGTAHAYFTPTPGGINGGWNNSILEYGNYSWSGTTCTVDVTWREPIFCSPFSSRVDATYGRPIYNITSMDLAFNMQNLGNMIRVANFTPNTHVTSYGFTFKSVNLCYQVMTIPSNVTKPLSTLLPYRRFVPYITDYTENDKLAVVDDLNKTVHTHHTSGVYTFNEIPQAIWIFVAPSKVRYQTNNPDNQGSATINDIPNVNYLGNWTSNKAFGFIDHISLTLANTTQILNTAKPVDLYRICKANGLQDSYANSFHHDPINPRSNFVLTGDTNVLTDLNKALGIGSVLRLIPGTDIIIPDQDLIPGANANNMVFQAEVDAWIPPRNPNQTQYSLWLLFEYAGVASISPGQCEITMNPLGTGEIMKQSPITSATSEATEGKLEGSGWLDNFRNRLRTIINKIVSNRDVIESAYHKGKEFVNDPKVKPKIDEFLKGTSGSGAIGRGKKRARTECSGGAITGGAVMGLGDFT